MSNKETYRKICSQRRDIPVFAQPWWLDVVCAEWDVAITMRGEHLAGVWPYPVEKKIGVRLLRTPMLTPYMGPVVLYPSDLKGSKADSYEYDTVADLVKQLPDAPVWHLSVQPGMKQAGIFRQQGLDMHVQQTFLLRLDQGEEMLLGNMKDTSRRNIRMAEREVTITDDPRHLRELYEFQKATLDRKGRAVHYSLGDLQRIMDAALANNAAALSVARSPDGAIQAIVWTVWDDTNCYYLMGGQNPVGDSYRTMTLLLWYSMKQAKARGNKVFDLEGSMDEGVERFFRSFGGERALYIILTKERSITWKLKQLLR